MSHGLYPPADCQFLISRWLCGCRFVKMRGNKKPPMLCASAAFRFILLISY
jgi:hypothetical protein